MNNNIHFVRGSRTGIDKLALYVKDFKIKDASKSGLDTTLGKINLKTREQSSVLLFQDGLGEKVFGWTAELEKNERVNSPYDVRINMNGLKLTINPSKPYHPYKLCDNDDLLQERLETVFKSLHSRGIDANYKDARITRIDLARNGEMNHPCIAYSPVFSMLRIPRATRQATFPDGYASNNNGFGFNCYNKGRELRDNNPRKKEYKQDNVIMRDYLMRQELQFKDKDVAAKRLQIVSINSLLEAGMNYLDDLYSSTLKADIYKSDLIASDQLHISFTDHVQTLIELRHQYGQQAINIWIKLFGIIELIEKTGSVTAFENILQEAGYGRTAIWKYRKQLHSLFNIRLIVKKQEGIGKLYREMVHKFVA